MFLLFYLYLFQWFDSTIIFLQLDLNEKESKIFSMEEQLIELNVLKTMADKNSEQNTSTIKELQLKIDDLELANQKLKQGFI